MINHIPDNIKYLRKREKLSQGELAEKLEKTQSTISCWESGKRDIILFDAFALCEYFNVPIEDFIDKEILVLVSASIVLENDIR